MPLTALQHRILALLASAPPLGEQGIVTHFGTPGGVLPRVV